MAIETTPEFLPDLICRYLNYQNFIRTASPSTLRAYRVDLEQAFELDKLGKILGPGVSGHPEFRFQPENTLDFSGLGTLSSASGLLSRCREALHHWSSLSPASRNRKAAALKAFLHWLYQEKWIDSDLAFQIHSPKVPIRLPHFLSLDEILAVLKGVKLALDQTDDPIQKIEWRRDQALILVLYGGGLRVSEACRLKWSDLRPDKNLLCVLGKGGKERWVAVPAMVMSAISALPHSSGEKSIWGEGGLSTRKAYEIVRQWGQRANLLKPLHPHALRHSFATHLLSSGTNLRTLQELLGHASLQATQKYTHLGIDQLARSMEELHPLGKNMTARKK
jgi:site-specific recombinase XerD